ncbi:hypothetical protein MUP37_06440 [Candidatus Bathyarchaeota archaeon]|nr:hypothetical protein [Candidatus Bathyarchaeota archaeon]
MTPEECIGLAFRAITIVKTEIRNNNMKTGKVLEAKRSGLVATLDNANNDNTESAVKVANSKALDSKSFLTDSMNPRFLSSATKSMPSSVVTVTSHLA